MYQEYVGSPWDNEICCFNNTHADKANVAWFSTVTQCWISIYMHHYQMQSQSTPRHIHQLYTITAEICLGNGESQDFPHLGIEFIEPKRFGSPSQLYYAQYRISFSFLYPQPGKLVSNNTISLPYTLCTCKHTSTCLYYNNIMFMYMYTVHVHHRHLHQLFLTKATWPILYQTSAWFSSEASSRAFWKQWRDMSYCWAQKQHRPRLVNSSVLCTPI